MTENNEQWLEELLKLAESDGGKKTEKQARILEAAIDIFAEKGFAVASTSEIAQKAGVAEGTIFRYYKTKKELLLAIAGPIALKLAAPFVMREFAVKVLDNPHPPEQVDQFFRSIAKDRFQFARKNIKMLRIWIHEIPYQAELLEQVQTLFQEIVYTRIDKIIRHYQELGQIIEAPPWRVLRTAVSLFVGMVVTHLLILPIDEADEDEEIDRTIDLLMHGLSPRGR
ncbi:TetR/AcrR family transcriptional regulator [Saccharibacillus sp. CPCC 101409]|uniref:TetR/AcrR family transcriptional regulator n=1 Tax=Saccharibacillus sp. CPCC 101409 TaxID=3058041 RepID=UPI002673E7A6|nr:TetR/AcrR family transcriptional regulator [Saccharibacillus sp. CPCC 101409]MDO3410575.1 TetR/AcrR family transcriptional regulator [Saccharibacillus sp. CPCC 101409]